MSMSDQDNAEAFRDMDEMADFAVEHASDLAELDRAAREQEALCN